MPEGFEPTVGEIYDVKITEALDYDLVGEILAGTYPNISAPRKLSAS